jgi:membrane protease YdiL (CAAX protease family)
MIVESSLISASILALLAVLMILPSLRRLPGIGVIPAMIVIALVTWWRGDGLEAIGLVQPDSWLQVIGLSVLFGLLIALASTVIIEPLSDRWTGVEHDLSALGEIKGNLRNTLTWITAAWAMAATIEEIIFRGYMMREIADLFGTSFTAVILNILGTSIVFGLAHWYQGKAGALSTGIVGSLLGVLFVWNDFQLWLLILTHGMIDTIGLLLIYLGWDEQLNHVIFKTLP